MFRGIILSQCIFNLWLLVTTDRPLLIQILSLTFCVKIYQWIWIDTAWRWYATACVLMCSRGVSRVRAAGGRVPRGGVPRRRRWHVPPRRLPLLPHPGPAAASSAPPLTSPPHTPHPAPTPSLTPPHAKVGSVRAPKCKQYTLFCCSNLMLPLLKMLTQFLRTFAFI